MTPQFKFTFTHPTVSAGGTVVTQPLGWKDASLSLVRDPSFHSLVEFFKGSFLWYGTARQFILDVEALDGPEGQVQVDIELTYDGVTWATVHSGLLDLSQMEEIAKKETYYKVNVPIIRDDFWAKFINRRTSKIDLESTTDLDGGSRTLVDKISLPLPSQVVRTNFERATDWADNVTRTLDETAVIAESGLGLTTLYALFTNSVFTLDEVSERFNYSTQVNGDDPLTKYFWKVGLKGTYQLDASIRYTFILSASRTFSVKWYYSVMSAGVMTTTQIGSTQSGTDSSIIDDGARTLSVSLNLNEGDTIGIWCELGLSSAVGTVSFFPDYDSDLGAPYDPVYTQLTLVADTVYPDSTTDAYLLKSAFESLVSKMVGQDATIVSDILDSCQGRAAIMRGKHIRGVLFSEKEMSTSFDELWKGAEPLLNLGLGYTEVSSIKKIEIESKEEFYDKVPVVFIPNVPDLVRSYDLDKHYRNINIGFNWSAESTNGIDDPQTKRSYTSKLATIGVDLDIQSGFYAASLGIEQTRRNRAEAGKDWRLDENLMLIALQPDGGDYRPEIGTDFNYVANLENSNTRYNIRHSCARVFKRWQKFIQGFLQHTTGEYFKFASGEGNYKMTSQFEITDCEATDDPEPILAEDQDILVDETNYCYIPKVYTARVPMAKATYDTIVANRKKAIAISQTTSGYLPMFIMNLDYKIFGGYAELELMLASNTTVEPSGDAILMEDGSLILQEDGTEILLE